MSDEDLRAELERLKAERAAQEPEGTERQPQGEREGRRVGLRARPLSGDALQGAVAEAARDDRRDSCVPQGARRRAQSQAGVRRAASHHRPMSPVWSSSCCGTPPVHGGRSGTGTSRNAHPRRPLPDGRSGSGTQGMVYASRCPTTKTGGCAGTSARVKCAGVPFVLTPPTKHRCRRSPATGRSSRSSASLTDLLAKTVTRAVGRGAQ